MGNCPRCGHTQSYINQCMDCGTKYCSDCPSPKYQPNQKPISQCPECGSSSVRPLTYQNGSWS